MTDEERWEDDYQHSTAGLYQAAHERAFREALAAGVQAPDGWRKPLEPWCPKCCYLIVRGSCFGCDERAARAAA